MKADGELLAAFTAAGDEKAFAELAARHYRMVYRVCWRILQHPQDAQDAAQAAFIVLLRRAEAPRAADLGGWLYGIARRTALAALRQRIQHARREVMATEGAVDLQGAADETAQREAILRRLDEELMQLSAAARQALILRFLEGHSEEESARLAGCSVATLSKRSSRAIGELRRRLAKVGVVVGAGALAAILEAESQAAVPEPVLTSILAVTKSAAAVAAGGAITSKAMLLAKGAIKMIFWSQVKVAALVAAGVAVVSGSGVLATKMALAAEKQPQSNTEIKPADTNAVVREPTEAVAVNGLKLTLAVKSGSEAVSLGYLRRSLGLECRGCIMGQKTAATDCRNCKSTQGTNGPPYCADCSIKLSRCYWCGRHIPSYTLCWENVGKDPLMLARGRESDLEGRVFIKGPDGFMAPVNPALKMRDRLNPMTNIFLAPGKNDSEAFAPWQWVVKPEKPGEYMLWIEFGQDKLNRDAEIPAGWWTGKIKSNPIKIFIAEDKTVLLAVSNQPPATQEVQVQVVARGCELNSFAGTCRCYYLGTITNIWLTPLEQQAIFAKAQAIGFFEITNVPSMPSGIISGAGPRSIRIKCAGKDKTITWHNAPTPYFNHNQELKARFEELLYLIDRITLAKPECKAKMSGNDLYLLPLLDSM